jgi:hypothetical protein
MAISSEQVMIDLQGRYLPLSPCRRVVLDLMHEAQLVPSVPVVRKIDLGDLVAIRRQSEPKISWFLIFGKAFSIVARQYPILRTCLICWPWARLYEHPFSICSLAIEREYQGENGLFFAHFRGPEYQSQAEMQRSLNHYKNDPVESIAAFRRILQVGQLPRFMRRLLWASSLNFSGQKRAKRMGTFGLTSYGSLGAESLHPISPLAFTLNFGPISPANRVAVKIIYDHRIADGAEVARRLQDLEAALKGPIRDELLGLDHTPHVILPEDDNSGRFGFKSLRRHMSEKLFRRHETQIKASRRNSDTIQSD